MTIAPPGPDPQHTQRRLAAGIWATLLLAAVVAVTSLFSVRAVIGSLSAVAFEGASDLNRTQELRIAVEVKGRKARGYLLMGDNARVEDLREADQAIDTRLGAVRAAASDDDERALVERVASAERRYRSALDAAITLRRGTNSFGQIQRVFEAEVQPARDDLDQAITELTGFQEQALRDATYQTRRTISLTLTLLAVIAGAALALALLLSVRLTRSLRAEQARRVEVDRYVTQVEQLNHELDAFAGRISHDIKNLLSPVSLTATMLRRSAGDAARTETLADRITRSVDRCLSMLDGLLLFSRSGRPEPLASCSVLGVVDEVLEPWRPLVAKNDVEVEVEVQDLEVACSRALLNVVLSNLIGNAIKFMESSPRRTLRITTATAGDTCEIAVADSGPGIPEEARGKLFEPFYRVPGTVAPGTGIGLATVARIVDAHGGSIAVEATPGGGATFRIRLPLAAGAARAA